MFVRITFQMVLSLATTTSLAIRLSDNVLVSINELPYTGPVSTGMGDRVQGSTPVWENLSQYITCHPGQLSLAIPPWVRAMSTSDGYGHR